MIKLSRIDLEQDSPPVRIGQNIGGGLPCRFFQPGIGVVRPLYDLHKIAAGADVFDGRRDGHPKSWIIVLQSRGGHPVPLELGEAGGAHDEVELQIHVLELPQRHVPDFMQRKEALKRASLFAGSHGCGDPMALLQRQELDAV